ncbi:unnamed protein product [Nesidiocoris tenuis]|uniref:Uncharacterized protein n=1 Tax=Nesidiocoris tenuis TaxID=355587 RepID=A0A6H5GSU4_9HEMI|nr:unnamed protein product [Nesidiocoris tenuis]
MDRTYLLKRTRGSNFQQVLTIFTHHPSPITHHPSPITHHPSPITHHPSPERVAPLQTRPDGRSASYDASVRRAVQPPFARFDIKMTKKRFDFQASPDSQDATDMSSFREPEPVFTRFISTSTLF